MWYKYRFTRAADRGAERERERGFFRVHTVILVLVFIARPRVSSGGILVHRLRTRHSRVDCAHTRELQRERTRHASHNRSRQGSEPHTQREARAPSLCFQAVAAPRDPLFFFFVFPWRKVLFCFFLFSHTRSTMAVRLTDHDLKYEVPSANGSKTLGQGNFGTAKLMRHKVGLL